MFDKVSQVATTILTLTIAYGTFKLIHYFTSNDKEKKADLPPEWDQGTNILLGHDNASKSLVKEIVNNAEKMIGEATMNRVERRLREIRAEFGPQTDIHLHLRSPGGELFFAQLIAHMLYEWKGKVTAHIHTYSASAGTLIALACDEIHMTPSSVLGPVDPQLAQASTHFSGTIFLDTVASLTEEQRNDVNVKKLLSARYMIREVGSLLTRYKTFLRTILAKNYNNKEQVEAMIEFFCSDRDHSAPIWRQECKDIGVHVVFVDEE